MPDNEATFPITYSVTIHDPAVTIDQIPDGHGACGAIFIGAYGEDPETSEVSVSFHGLEADGEELKPLQIFQVWLSLTEQLAKTLPEGGPKELCASVRTVAERAIQMSKEEQENDQSDSDETD
jgi:hypothetical protein